MKEITLLILRTFCFIFGICIGFFGIYLQGIEYDNDFVYIILAIITGGSLLFFSTSFLFINTEKEPQSQSFTDVGVNQ